VKSLRAGATSDDVLDAADIIAQRGYTINDGFLHGFGIGLLPPSIGTRESAAAAGSVPNSLSRKTCRRDPAQCGHSRRARRSAARNLFRITSDGAECLHRLPLIAT
jgi:hypothetical protein